MNEAIRVLVVDDDPLTAELAAAALEGAGYSTLIAEGGIDALDQLACDPSIQVVVSDLHMPLLDGLELHREMREAGHPQAFVLLSARDATSLLPAHPGIGGTLLKDDTLLDRLPEIVARLVRG